MSHHHWIEASLRLDWNLIEPVLLQVIGGRHFIAISFEINDMFANYVYLNVVFNETLDVMLM